MYLSVREILGYCIYLARKPIPNMFISPVPSIICCSFFSSSLSNWYFGLCHMHQQQYLHALTPWLLSLVCSQSGYCLSSLPLYTTIFLLDLTEAFHSETVLECSLFPAFQFMKEKTPNHSGIEFPVGDSFSQQTTDARALTVLKYLGLILLQGLHPVWIKSM